MKFDTQLMARNESAAKSFRQFAQLFLDESAKLDRLRATSPVPQQHVAPVRMVFSTKAVVRQADLPPGRLVRAWFPYHLERRQIRDFFFGRLDRWRLCTQRNTLAQELVPVNRSPRRHVTMFVRPELECDGQDVEQRTLTWDCQPEKGEDACGK